MCESQADFEFTLYLRMTLNSELFILPSEEGIHHIPSLPDLCVSCLVSLEPRALATAKPVKPTVYTLKQARYQRTTVGTTAHSHRSCEWMAHSFLVALVTQQDGDH